MRVVPAYILAIICLAAPRVAVADRDLVIVGPVASAPKISVAPVIPVLDAAEVAPRDARAIDPACAISATCLAEAGVQLGARRVLAVSVGRTTTKGITLDVVLVDVSSKDLLARRAISIPAKKLAKNLAPALKKFLDEAPVERAKALFALGNEHYNLGEFAQSLDMYKRAYRAKPLPAFLFNIAQCHRKLGQHQEALTMYQSYLAGIPDAQNKTVVESLIAESTAKLEEAQAAEAAAEQARREAERIASEKQKAEEIRRAKEAELAAEAERTRAEQARIAADRDVYNKHPARTWAYLGAGLGAAAMLGGAYFGMQAGDRQAAFDSAGCGDPTQLLTQAELATCQDDRDQGERNALIGNALLIGGGAILAASVLVFVIDPGNIERAEEPRAQLRITPTSIQAVVRW